MALDTPTLKTGIEQLMTDMRTRDQNADDEYATRFSNLIEAFVKSGDGKITQATMVAGSNAVTATNTVLVKMQ
jgi:hypothetical protein